MKILLNFPQIGKTSSRCLLAVFWPILKKVAFEKVFQWVNLQCSGCQFGVQRFGNGSLALTVQSLDFNGRQLLLCRQLIGFAKAQMPFDGVFICVNLFIHPENCQAAENPGNTMKISGKWQQGDDNFDKLRKLQKRIKCNKDLHQKINK